MNTIPGIIEEAVKAGCENADQIHGYLAGEVSRLRGRQEKEMAELKLGAIPIWTQEAGFEIAHRLHRRRSEELTGGEVARIISRHYVKQLSRST